MTYRTSPAAARWVALAGLVFAYFVVFPGDATAVTAPVANLLRLSRAISPWLYLVVGVGIIAWTALAIWGPKASSGTDLSERA